MEQTGNMVHVCHVCSAPGTGMCACLGRTYCSRSCQNTDWSNLCHADVCTFRRDDELDAEAETYRHPYTTGKSDVPHHTAIEPGHLSSAGKHDRIISAREPSQTVQTVHAQPTSGTASGAISDQAGPIAGASGRGANEIVSQRDTPRAIVRTTGATKAHNRGEPYITGPRIISAQPARARDTAPSTGLVEKAVVNKTTLVARTGMFTDDSASVTMVTGAGKDVAVCVVCARASRWLCKCRARRFCRRACQTQDWRAGHRLVCTNRAGVQGIWGNHKSPCGKCATRQTNTHSAQNLSPTVAHSTITHKTTPAHTSGAPKVIGFGQPGVGNPRKVFTNARHTKPVPTTVDGPRAASPQAPGLLCSEPGCRSTFADENGRRTHLDEFHMRLTNKVNTEPISDSGGTKPDMWDTQPVIEQESVVTGPVACSCEVDPLCPKRLLRCATAECPRPSHNICCHGFTESLARALHRDGALWYCNDCKVCTVCGTGGDEGQMLLCDACDQGTHAFCLTPPQPQLLASEDLWFCGECVPSAKRPDVGEKSQVQVQVQVDAGGKQTA
ncbi:hypothetical protein SARC_12403 [Sphaeroforma arctica JP610]|uniref:PHD-type domain-containing protein n=1 Tax=Sphaeroforma arctica JP610 TaxID=667725 RepID=A0A0L0FE87_9EUKA|nr:hypothetical protein SARC_12403 [Sphaeroforma arctica JP610]KNC75064.1 hypothetical protein SARC_12403 [Sphaeroforma arctica JP610]|eukprot:XP_014148966.1 hypothetical protein SARC_12403 [Sphaeroforma arctica JP610]